MTSPHAAALPQCGTLTQRTLMRILNIPHASVDLWNPPRRLCLLQLFFAVLRLMMFGSVVMKLLQYPTPSFLSVRVLRQQSPVVISPFVYPHFPLSNFCARARCIEFLPHPCLSPCDVPPWKWSANDRVAPPSPVVPVRLSACLAPLRAPLTLAPTPPPPSALPVPFPFPTPASRPTPILSPSPSPACRPHLRPRAAPPSAKTHTQTPFRTASVLVSWGFCTPKTFFWARKPNGH